MKVWFPQHYCSFTRHPHLYLKRWFCYWENYVKSFITMFKFFPFQTWRKLNFFKPFCTFDTPIHISKNDSIKLKIVRGFFRRSFLVCISLTLKVFICPKNGIFQQLTNPKIKIKIPEYDCISTVHIQLYSKVWFGHYVKCRQSYGKQVYW